MLHTLKFRGWKSFFMNCPCVKRKFFLKDMNCERYVVKLIILGSKCTLLPIGTCWLHAEVTVQFSAPSCRRMERKKLWQYGEGYIQLKILFWLLSNSFFNLKLSLLRKKILMVQTWQKSLFQQTAVFPLTAKTSQMYGRAYLFFILLLDIWKYLITSPKLVLQNPYYSLGNCKYLGAEAKLIGYSS